MWRILLGLILLSSTAHASGSCWPIFGETAGGPGIAFDANSSMASSTYSANNLPTMTDASDGGFYAFTKISKLCGAGTVTFQPDFLNLDGTSVDDANVCLGAAVTVLTAGSSGDSADWTFEATPTVASTDLGDCDNVDPSEVCTGTATAAITMHNEGIAGDCATTACNDKRAVVYVYRDTGASCTGASDAPIQFIDGWLCCP